MKKELELVERLNSLTTGDIKDISIELNPGTRTIPIPHYRIRCSYESFPLLAATLHDLGLPCERYTKDGKDFLAMERNLIGAYTEDNFPGKFASVYAANKSNLAPKLHVEKIEESDMR